MLPIGRLGGTPAMSGLCFGHSDCNRRAPSHAVMYHYNFECDVAAPLFPLLEIASNIYIQALYPSAEGRVVKLDRLGTS